MVMGLHLVKICKTVCLTTVWREIVFSYFGRVLDFHNSYDNFLLGGSTVATCKVWCKWVKLLRRSLKKCVFNLWQFCKRFVQHIMWAVLAKNGFVLIIAPPAGHFYCVSYRGQSILFYYFDLR